MDGFLEWLPFICIMLILCYVSSFKELKFKNDNKNDSFKEYYLKYRLSDNEDYGIAYSEDFEEISKATSDFLLVDIEHHKTLSKEESMKILNSEHSDIMLGVGDWVQVWYSK